MNRKYLKSIVMMGAVVLTLAACKSRKLVEVPPVVKKDTVTIVKSTTLQLLKNKTSTYQTLSMRGKAQLNINGDENNVSVNIRMLKDKKIWMSVTAIAGIEIARVLVTPDSLVVINRLQGLVLQQPFRYIHQYANREINFSMLQDILAGNAIKEFMVEDVALTSQNGAWLLKGQKNSLGFQILFNTLLKASQTNLNDVRTGQALKVVYGSYTEVNQALYPTGMQLQSFSGRKKINIDFDFTKIESNVTLDFSFTVPKRFQVIN
ncbi:hypothetical protein IWX76_003149 [Pedobacter sp. CAN_A7]|uniref:DUF4292 domain-containing protein n=1 Tax=Pedobacter sp. CAN_A7 TaxID=2787722 RepID=UPI0018C9B66B